jgi:Flp pilus assembly protein TadD
MKRTVATLLLCLALLPAASAATPEEQYVDLYQVIQQGIQLQEQGKDQAAFALYRRAEVGLKQLRKDHPQWNDNIVSFRLADLAERIKPLAAKFPEPVLTPAPASEPKAAAKAKGKASATSPSANLESQLALLTEEIISLRADRTLLEKKLAEALAARPAATDPAELARAEARFKDAQKENDVLRATLQQTQRDMAGLVPAATVAETRKQLEAAQGELKQQSRAMAGLQKENAAAAKLKDENSALKKDLSAAEKTAREAAKLESANQELKAEIAALKTRQTSLEDDNKRLAKMSRTDDSGNAALRKDLEDANRKLAQQAALNARVESMGAQLKDAQQTIAALRRDNEKMEKLLTDPSANLGNAPAPANDAALRQELARARRDAEQAQAAEAAARAMAQAERDRAEQSRKELEEQLKVAMAASGKSSPRDAARIKELEQEREKLEKELKAASRELNDRQSKRQTAKVEDMADELAALKARIEVLEAKPVPYTREELALFKKPEAAPAAPVETARKATQELPDSARPLVAEAQRDFASRRFADAERKYRQVLAVNDSHVFTLANLAAAQIEQGDLNSAEKSLEKALGVSPDDAFALSQMGFLRMRQNKLDDALNHLSRAAQKDPKDAVVQNYLGVVLSEKGQRAAAEAALRKAVQLSPGYADAHHNLAVIYATQKPPMTELARWHYGKARAAGQPVNADLEKMLSGN